MIAYDWFDRTISVGVVLAIGTMAFLHLCNCL